MTTALIADDERLLREQLRARLSEVWPELEILAEAKNGAEAVEQVAALHPDIVFLDIRMPGMTGLEAAQALSEDWPDGSPLPLIVFVTAYDQYAVQAFDHAAFDYVLKPVQTDRLAQTCGRLQATLHARAESPSTSASASSNDALDSAMSKLRELLAAPGIASSAVAPAPRLTMIQASVGQTIQMVPVDEVLYFEAADKYVRVVTAQRDYLIRTSLRELLPQLDPQRFWQVHRGTLVRSDAIASALRDESGKVHLSLRGHADKLVASRLYAHLFKAM
jgi:DNA-binding LytR/AlgR family response regulator